VPVKTPEAIPALQLWWKDFDPVHVLFHSAAPRTMFPWELTRLQLKTKS
jgi:hypothetical protein